MGRIRTIKPELPQQPWFAGLSDAAARTYYGLLSLVDDSGRCPADRSYIGGQILWHRRRTPAVIGSLLDELERAEIIRRYLVRGGEYLEILGWAEKGGPLYQQIDRPQGERFPGPESIQAANAPRTLRERSTSDPIRKGSDPEDDQEGILELEPEPESPPPPPSRARRAPAGDHALVVKAFHDRYLARFSTPPTWGARQGKAIKQLLAQHPAAEIERRIAILFDSPPAFLASSPPDVGTLVCHFDKLAAPSSTNGQRGQQYVTAAGLRAEIEREEQRELDLSGRRS